MELDLIFLVINIILVVFCSSTKIKEINPLVKKGNKINNELKELAQIITIIPILVSVVVFVIKVFPYLSNMLNNLEIIIQISFNQIFITVKNIIYSGLSSLIFFPVYWVGYMIIDIIKKNK